MMFTLSAPALAESTDALMQLNISGNRAVSVLDAENGNGITVNGVEVTDANKDDVLAGTLNAGKLRYENGALCSDNVQLSGILRVTAPGTNIELNGGAYSPLATIYINDADNVTISSDNYSAIGNKAEIDCTGKVTINASGNFGTYAIGARSQADEGTLIIRNASAVEINAPQYNQVIGGRKGIADITCNGPVTIRGNAESGNRIAKNFTYQRTDGADYVYYTSEDAETEAIDGSITPIPSDAPYSYLHIEEKTFSAITVNNGIAKAGGSEVQMAFNGQKVTVTAQIDETDERKFDGWEVVNAPAGFTISAEKLAQKEFSFIMPTGNVELTAHHSNKLEVSGGTAKVNGNSNADFARPGAAVTVTAGSPEDYQFDHWEVSGGNIGKTEEELKVSPLSFTMPDAAVKLTAVYKAAVKVSNGTAQTDNTTGETVYALEGASVTVTGHDSNASFSKLVGWKLKKGSLTAIIDADGNSLNVTVDAENNYLLDASGAKIKNETFTFTMSDKPVELSAVYSIPAIAMSLPVIVEGGTINCTQDSFVRVKAGEKVTIKADAPAENMQFHHWKVEEGTSADFGVTVGTLGSDTEQGTEEIAFIMPRGAVRLTAQWSATPATRPDPDQPLDEDFGVDTPQPKPEPEEPEAPAESAAGAIAAVAIGGAAGWGGGAWSLGIDAVTDCNASTVDDFIKSGRDNVVSLGGSAIAPLSFEQKYENVEDYKRKAEAALLTTSGHMAFLHSGTSAFVGQDIIEKDWSADLRDSVFELFTLQNSYAAFNAGGMRYRVPTNDDSVYYAYCKADRRGGTRAVVVFNYSASEKQIEVDLSGTGFGGAFVDMLTGKAVEGAGKGLKLTIPGGSYKILGQF